jgi:hypothetical protein
MLGLYRTLEAARAHRRLSRVRGAEKSFHL